MKTETLILLALLGVGAYYVYKKTQATPTAATQPGGGSGPNASTAGAYNGVLNPSTIGGGIDYLTGLGASIGHLLNGNGGATANDGGSSGGSDASAGSDTSGYN